MAKENKVSVDLNRLLEDYNQAHSYQQRYSNIWRKCYEAYTNNRKDLEVRVNGKSKIKIPAIFYIVETIIPRLAGKLLGSKPIFNILPRTADDMDKAEILEILLDYQLEQVNFDEKLIMALRDMELYSVGIFKWFWEYDIYNGNDRPNFIVVNPNAFFIDPDATDIDDARYVIHRVYLSKAQIQKYIEKGIFNRVKSIDDITLTENKEKQESKIGRGMENIKGKYEFFEYWTPNKVYTFTKGELVREDDNVYREIPFIAIKNIPMSDQFYSLSDAEMLLDLEQELITKRRQRLDNVNFVLNTMFIVERGAEIDERELVTRSGGIIHTNDREAIDVLKFPDVTQSAYVEVKELEREMQNISGAFDYLRGVTQHSRETATSVMTLTQEGNMRFYLKLLSIYKKIAKLALAFVKMSQLFMNKKQIIRIVGEVNIEGVETISKKNSRGETLSFLSIDKSDIKGNYDIIPVFSNTILSNLMNYGQLLLQLFQLLKDSPYIKQYNFIKTIFDIFQIRNRNFLLKTQKELEEEAQAQMQMMNMIAQMQAQGNVAPPPPTAQPTAEGEAAPSSPSATASTEETTPLIEEGAAK